MLKTTPALLVISTFIALLIPSCKGESQNRIANKATNVKQSQLAGSWYPASKDELTKMLDSYLKEANPPSFENKEIVGIISPHAGYVYSGKGAAFAYKAISDRKIDRVIILAPSHHSAFRGFSTPDYTHYETPLGLVEIDKPIVDELKKEKLHIENPGAHIPEHSIEIQLPFLQISLKNFKVVPILIGEMTQEDYESLGKILRKYVGSGTIFVVSSDFTHYGDNFDYHPFKFKKAPSANEVKDVLKRLDGGAIDEILKLSFKGFRDYVTKSEITICGRNPIALFLKILEGEEGVTPSLLKYYTSIDSTGDYSSSVSYTSMIFTREKKGKSASQIENLKSKNGEVALMITKETYNLSGEEKNVLLRIARDTLNSYLSKKEYPDKKKYNITANLEAKRGVFVTLTEKGDLRGCIGYIEGIKPVYQAVMENAVNAALEDPRFPSVTLEEIPKIDIEISVMTPLTPVEKIDEIEIGKHGLVIAKGWNRGLLLPQVATEWKMDRNAFLEAVSNKAGLPRDAWKDKNSKLEKFSAIVFNEKEVKKNEK